jgi:hypothetical protein
MKSYPLLKTVKLAFQMQGMAMNKTYKGEIVPVL